MGRVFEAHRLASRPVGLEDSAHPTRTRWATSRLRRDVLRLDRLPVHCVPPGYDTALARIRQLSAHEVGHTLGLGHNYYDSTKGWISVLDYPHPLEQLRPDGTIDLSQAYQARIGDWDKVAINYGYREFPKGTNEAAALRKILDDAWTEDLRYFTNQDTDIHPRVEQWSNGVNQGDELTRLMKVRRAALNRLGQHTIRSGRRRCSSKSRWCRSTCITAMRSKPPPR